VSAVPEPVHGSDPATDELRKAHDVLAAFYVERLAGALEASPRDRSVLDLFATLVTQAGLGTEVADVGCGTGRLEPYLASVGLRPHGVDLSPEMVRVAHATTGPSTSRSPTCATSRTPTAPCPASSAGTR